MEALTVVAGLMIAVGIVGLVIPVLPGLAVCVGGVLVWALARSDRTGWVVFGLALAVAVAGWIVQYTVPSRRMRRDGVPTSTLLAGAALGVVGFFVVPVIGLFLGFVLGVFLVENVRLHNPSAAWRQTKSALRGVALSVGIELIAAVSVALIWVAGLLVTR